MKTAFKKTIGLLCGAALLAFLTGCASYNNNQNVADIVRHFQERGVKVDSVAPMPAEILRAESAVAIEVSGRQFGVYKFDIKVKKQKEKLDKIEENGSVYIMGVRFPALVNGSFMMMDYDQNPEKEKIVAAFKSF